MVRTVTPLLCLLLLSFAVLARAITHQNGDDSNSTNDCDNTTSFQATCALIETAISSASTVYYPPLPNTRPITRIGHRQLGAVCVQCRTWHTSRCWYHPTHHWPYPYAICRQGGGHTSNPGFSSTSGVQISMTRFNSVTVDNATSTVAIGAGLLWDDVYKALNGTGLNVVGGRVPGVGVAGLTLGGGYSWKTNQFGLVIDNIDSYEMVLPDGRIKIVRSEDEDLWFGLRGGYNNFGIVTKFVLKAHPQGNVWGGIAIISGQYFDQINAAVVKFQQEPALVLLMFYDGPERPEGIFDDFLALPDIQIDVRSGSFFEFFGVIPPTDLTGGTRAYFSSVPVLEYSPALVDAIVNETLFWGAKLAQLDKGTTVSFAVESYDAGLFTHSPASQPSAYPPDRSRPLLPMNIYFGWTNPALDAEVANALRESSRTVRNAAVADGQDVLNAAKYPNNALFGTPLVDIYGTNVPRLKEIRRRVDPRDVMGLAGGFKF
ncbi:hypothetical protein B0F90DRAFT_1876599 [Multifurca ochricompacta]|uniref:FAD-binding PCMH-type domain-containing protein n=1 Tax=Multifurca ochricompacta TaxID=376703 RepID=A0AAD4QLI8_9AGAM|nr:hypothetical protein B0F90DRAFT_1876599 [Multifurca ochricompacta]